MLDLIGNKRETLFEAENSENVFPGFCSYFFWRSNRRRKFDCVHELSSAFLCYSLFL